MILSSFCFWILDVALSVGNALKDDDKVGECVFEGKYRKMDCRVVEALPLLLAMTLAGGGSTYHKGRESVC
jgi:hypothetical protein